MMWISLAFAAPERVAATWTVASPGEWAEYNGVVGIVGDGLTLLDLGTWETTAIAVCSEPKGIAGGEDDDGSAFWVGCADGTLNRVSTGGDVTTVEVGAGEVTAVEYDGDVLYVISKDGSGLGTLSAVAPDGTVQSPYPTTLSREAVSDTLLIGSDLYVLHGGDEVSRVSTGNAVVNIAREYTAADYASAFATSGGLIYLSDAAGGDVWNFDLGDNGFSYLLLDIADAVTSLCVDETSLWSAISGDEDLLIYDWSSGTFGSAAGSVLDVGALDRTRCTEGGALGLSTAGSRITFVSDLPWVTINDAPSTAADTVAFSLSSDIAGDYAISIGGDLASSTEVQTGTIDSDASASVDLPVDSTWVEGENRIWVTVTDDAGRIGHDAVDISVDTPPDTPVVSVGIGESTLSVSIAASEAEDLSTYTLYISDSAFAASDYSTGGPELGTDEVENPVTLTATPGEQASYTYYPLTNGKTYWVAVRATDAGGLESALSAVQSAVPAYTYSASELAGDEGGFACGTGLGVGWFGVLAALGAVRRRR